MLLNLKKWEASYSVGNWVLDNQHKVLLGLCDETIELLPDDVDEPLDYHFSYAQEDLLVCIDEHFKTEERLLKSCSKSLYERHHEEHEHFRKSLSEKLQDVAMGKMGREEFRQFLTEWWSHHILNSDRNLTPFIQRVQ